MANKFKSHAISSPFPNTGYSESQNSLLSKLILGHQVHLEWLQIEPKQLNFPHCCRWQTKQILEQEPDNLQTELSKMCFSKCVCMCVCVCMCAHARASVRVWNSLLKLVHTPPYPRNLMTTCVANGTYNIVYSTMMITMKMMCPAWFAIKLILKKQTRVFMNSDVWAGKFS